MKIEEAKTLKTGDLVVMDNRSKYGGLVFEVENLESTWETWCCRVTLKQPGFDMGFRIKGQDTRYLKRYEG